MQADRLGRSLIANLRCLLPAEKFPVLSIREWGRKLRQFLLI